ncbi:hypothetical protein [Streptomyces sp. NPDC047197]|uniref:hypothetical protein n=1 Tax=Streptomyces sp. NPDC047197 TaxID=3155477 RepID=UPI00340E4DD7
MAKPPTVIGVLTTTAPPSWWRSHRHQVLLILGLIVGFHLATHDNDSDAAPKNTPRPAHTAPAPQTLHPTTIHLP